MNVAFRPKFWYVASQGFGVTFELSAVQVIELSNGGEDLSGGFDAEEEETTLTANF